MRWYVGGSDQINNIPQNAVRLIVLLFKIVVNHEEHCHDPNYTIVIDQNEATERQTIDNQHISLRSEEKSA